MQSETLRAICQNSIIAYELAHDPTYKAARVHNKIDQALMRVVRGECKRLMIFVPPQHGKSRLVSETLPTFYHGHHPRRNIIHLTYGGDFAKKFGRANRNKLRSAVHSAIFGSGLADDNQSSDRYQTSMGGNYMADGIRGGVTGNPADLIIIDDPIKNRMEVRSHAIMRDIRDNLSGAVRSRMHKDTAIIVMHTRWDEADPAGWLMEEWGHENWEILVLPALVETKAQEDIDPLGRKIGESLWPERFPTEFLLSTKKALLPRDWAALYQQSPVVDGGNLFSREDFNWYDPEEMDLLKDLQMYGAHDGAVATPEEGRDPDMTEIAAWGVDRDWSLYAVDWWSCQENLEDWGEIILDFAEDWGINRWASENGVIRHASEPYLKRRKKDRGLQLSFDWLPHVGDKEANVAIFRALVKSGNVYLPINRDWAEDLVDQLVKFPTGRYDDMVDVCGFIGRLINKMMANIPSRSEKKEPEYGTFDWLVQWSNSEISKEGKKTRRRR